MHAVHRGINVHDPKCRFKLAVKKCKISCVSKKVEARENSSTKFYNSINGICKT